VEFLGSPVPASEVHTAAAALAPALRHLPKLSWCELLGRPVSEGILQLLPPSLTSLRVTQRAKHAHYKLAAASCLQELEIPDLTSEDKLPPSLRKLVVRGQLSPLASWHPLLHLTQLETLELLGCRCTIGMGH
jgi:hypothetical protein